MTLHGGGVPFDAPGPGAPDQSPGPPLEGDFRHFIRTPQASEKYRLFDQPPEADPQRTRDVLRRLGHCLIETNHWADPLPSASAVWENPTIPAGYTYLGQLVAHDLVQTSLTFPSLQTDRGTLRNNRSYRLDLDTLYGAGPASCPHAYAIPKGSGLRTRLRLSRMRQSDCNVPGAQPPFRDIGRGCAYEANDDRRVGATEPLLADPRNDDNAVLSQVTTIFIHLHNYVLDRLEEVQPNPGNYAQDVWLERQFLVARRIVTEVYRNIVRHDLLPKIVGGTVLNHYLANPSHMVDQDDGARMPLEFSHGAYRFGHAMVRREYSFNALHDPFHIKDVMSHVSRRLSHRMPLNENWIIQWSRFFDLGDRSIINFSRRIGPDLPHRLDLPNEIDFPRDGTPHTLAHRDLLRNAATELWSVKALADEIQRRQPALLANSRVFADFAGAQADMESWLKQKRARGVKELSDAEIAALVKDPPFFFFILYEAAVEAKGQHLGTLGSIIVAETLLNQLGSQHDPAQGGLTEQVLGTDDIKTMPDLLGILAEHTGLQNADPAFL